VGDYPSFESNRSLVDVFHVSIILGPSPLFQERGPFLVSRRLPHCMCCFSPIKIPLPREVPTLSYPGRSPVFSFGTFSRNGPSFRTPTPYQPHVPVFVLFKLFIFPNPVVSFPFPLLPNLVAFVGGVTYPPVFPLMPPSFPPSIALRFSFSCDHFPFAPRFY